MNEKKGWGQTVLGWFVVQDEPQLDADIPITGSIVDAIDARSGRAPLSPPPLQPPVAATSRPAAKAPSPAAPAKPAGATGKPAAAPPAPTPQIFQKEPPKAEGGNVNFAKVFEAANIGAEEQDRVAKAIQLLHDLPADTPAAVKKQIVEASLKAFGVPIDNIIESGVEEIQALEGYIRAVAAATSKQMDESETRIKKLEETIKELRDDMQKRATEQQAIVKNCNTKKLEVQQILEFFGQEAVAKVVQESPKLHDPTQVK
jgi:cell division protein FtsB